MAETLRVLIVEDSADDTLLMVRELQRGGFDPSWQRVETEKAMRTALEGQVWDIVISDYSMPQFGGADALALCQRQASDVPFISVSGTIGEDIAVAMMKAGAHDYVMKDRMGRLVPAVKRELGAAEERRVRRRAETAMAHLASIVESCEDAIIGKTLEGIITSWNQGAERLYGYAATEMIGRTVSELVPPYRPQDKPELDQMIKSGQRVENFETVRLRKDGKSVDVSMTISPIRDSTGQIVGSSTVERDITRRKSEEQERLRLIQELTEALARVKTLTGLLPMCASCKKIRNDNGYWQQVETYIKEHSEADFTHGICPDCMKRLYPEYSLNPSI
jgi:two-component system cell cycle sensor histidine kinase/response regulator CckA